jgi:cellulose synthase/poly-beta-1,6-N-acetylglucosamine synthase-like glycosyltransferase
MEFEGINKRFEELQVCVIIPTYNNHLTLAGVITDVSAYSNHIIVINDGSTDNTEAIVTHSLMCNSSAILKMWVRAGHCARHLLTR